MARRYQPRLNREAKAWSLISIPILSVMLGSMTTLLPIIAETPFLPPFGLMILIAWRMLSRDIWPLWITLPLGFYDDMFSGQPLGSAILLWTLCFFVLDLFDRGMIWRDYKQDWGIAAILLTLVLLAMLWIANSSGGNTAVWIIIPQILFTIFSWPMVVRCCAALDRLRWRL
jgi:rod shape-determining protein MreD